MNNLNFKKIITATILQIVIFLVIQTLILPLLPNDFMLVRTVTVILIFIIGLLVTLYIFKSKNLTKINGSAQGFLGGVIAAGTIMFIFVVLLSGFTSVAAMVFLIVGSTVGGYLAGKK